MHTMGVSPAASAALVFLKTISLVSPKNVASFGVADDRVAATGLHQHARGDFPGERAFLFPVNVLRGDGNVRALDGFNRGRNGGERWSDDDVAIGDAGDQRIKRREKRARVRLRFVHLPVAGNDAATLRHCSFVGEGLHARKFTAAEKFERSAATR